MREISCIKRGLITHKRSKMILTVKPISLPIEENNYKNLIYVVPTHSISNRNNETWIEFGLSEQLCSGSGRLPTLVEQDLKEFLGVGRSNYAYSSHYIDSYRIRVQTSASGKTYYYLDLINFPKEGREIPLKLIDPQNNTQTYFEPLIQAVKTFGKNIICVKKPIETKDKDNPQQAAVEILA